MARTRRTSDGSRPVTSYEVAQLAGVTQPTVSRALRGERVAEATRLRVLAAADSLGYVPSETGRALATQKTNRIGVVTGDFGNALARTIIPALERSLAERGMHIMLFRDEGDDEALVRRITRVGVDGVVLTYATTDSRQVEMLTDRSIPVLVLYRETDRGRADVCVSDNEKSGGMVADRLLELGHRRIGAIMGPANTSTGRDRARGFRDGLAVQGVALHPDLVKEVPFEHAAGHDAMLQLLDADEPPTAVFCANDVLAIGALNAARLRGVLVPDDVTVIGHDDTDMASWEVFDLTTIRQDLEEISRQAAELLLARLDDPDGEVRRVVVEPALILRGTDGAPRR